MRFRRTPKYNDMPYATAARILRVLVESCSKDRKTLLALARRCRDAAPPDQLGMREMFQKFVDAYENKRQIRFSTAPTRVWLDGESPEMEAEVESAFAGMEDPFKKETSS